MRSSATRSSEPRRWGLPGIKGSFDQILDPLDHHEHVRFDLGGMFDFGSPPNTSQYILDPTTGEPAP